MNTKQARQAYLDFFASKGHQIVSSSSLVPKDDPTLLFSNAGMNQFKDLFLGAEKREYSRATTAQKCMRISGKHNDLENVGVTARHHTFFEMMGNFSFGDYFKKDAIAYAWEFSTKYLKFDVSRLWITIFENDDEAGKLWQEVGVSPDRILKCGEADNFWAMGDTGPCGPCSELHYYVGNKPESQCEADFRKDDGSYLEFWNLVFMQFNRDTSGVMNPLPKPSIDTGMGLERAVSILNGFAGNYDTDSLRGVISTCEEISGYKYDGRDYTVRDLKTDINYARDVAMRVIADHTRSISFLIADGVNPASDGRGYVLRRLIRRAIRHGRVLNFKDLFLAKTCEKLISIMSDAYPELAASKDLILRIASAEESKFNETLDSGLEYLEEEVKKLGKAKSLSGRTAFLLHDTYGFPLDLTEDALKIHGISVDRQEFDLAMNEQKDRSRLDRESQNITYSSVNVSAPETKFLGYEALTSTSELKQLITHEEGNFSLFFDSTPFYAESGGQVGDTGEIKFKDANLKVLNTQKISGKYFLHYCELLSGTISEKDLGSKAELQVDVTRRQIIRAHHSATHLVHAGLRKFLGTHVKQAGSRVDSNSLRFDYSHFESVTPKELQEIQAWVNQEIRNNYPIETKIMDLETAKATGAMALFDEKYSDQVRVVHIGPNSTELCGGTHASASGEIGFLTITSESGIATGTRRIECVAGLVAEQRLSELTEERLQIAEILKVDQANLLEKLQKTMERLKQGEREIQQLKSKLAVNEADELCQTQQITKSGLKVVVGTVDNLDQDSLRTLVDRVRLKLGSGVVTLASQMSDGTNIVISGATGDLKNSINVGKALGDSLKLFGGRGGGRADFAQGGGLEPKDLQPALDKFFALVSDQ